MTGCSEDHEGCSNGVVVAGRAEVVLSGVRLSDSPDTGLVVKDSARATVRNSEISDNRTAGLNVVDTARVRVEQSVITGNTGSAGVLARDRASLSLEEVEVTGNGYSGLWAVGTASVEMNDSVVKENKGGYDYGSGVVVIDRASVVIRRSLIEGNGTDTRCTSSQWPSEACHGVLVAGSGRLTLTDSTVRRNTDWGVAAWHPRCGYQKEMVLAQVVLEGNNVFEGNNRGRKATAQGDGQLCLPEGPVELIKRRPTDV
jgi:hypothetical protein